MLFGVPDEITDMMRSIEMVKRYILIYRAVVFGQQKCPGGTGYVSGLLEGVPGIPPTTTWA